MSFDIKKSNTLSVARYARSAKGKATRSAYKASPKGLAVQKAGQEAFLKKKRTLLAALKSVPCADCGGVFDPVCMDFDHRPGEVKCFGVSGRSKLSDILCEAKKCDVVCANCHRIRTHLKRNHGATVAAGKAKRKADISKGIG